MAKFAAASVPASIPGIGFEKCARGSEIPQNTRPTPMPAPNSMANQDTVEYSGLESSGPSLIFPHLLNAIATEKITNAVMAIRYSQPKLLVRNEYAAFETTVKLALKATAHIAMIMVIASETTNT